MLLVIGSFSLPAATTTVVPREIAPLIAWEYSLVHGPSPPSDMLMTFAGVGLAGTPGTLPPDAQVMAVTMSEL